MNPATRRTTLGAIPAAPLTVVAKPAEASASLLRLYEEYEALHRKMVAESNRLDEGDTIWSAEVRNLVSACGRMRAAIAFHPVDCIADVLLKVRCFALTDDAADGWHELRSEVEYRGGHAYDMDVAHAVMLHLMRIYGFGPCA